MHIFIDESGPFIPLSGAKSRASAVLGLVIPSSSQRALRRAFQKLKRRLGAGSSELKGSAMSEADAAAVIDLLRGYDVIVEAVVVDAGAHDAAAVSQFKLKQADRLFGNITRDHHPNLIQELLGYRAGMQALSDQLFLQVFCIWELIPRMLETATMYYSQRRPSELGSFVWRVDAKDKAETTMERLWTTLIGPVIMEKSVDAPMAMMPGADYSFFDRFDMDPPDGTVRQPNRYYTDMRKVLREDFGFASSASDLGIQLADVVASILTRALNHTMQIAGWHALGSLFIHRQEQTVRHIALSWDAEDDETQRFGNPQWAPVVRRIETHSRPMVTAAAMARAEQAERARETTT